MESRPLIRRVVLENYKSIAFCDVKLTPLTILVGPNGAGKSNFVDALRFLSEAMDAPVEKAFQNREGYSNVLRRRTHHDGHLGIRIEFITPERLTGFYAVRFTRGKEVDYIVESEKCSIGSISFYNQPAAVQSSSQVEPTRLHLPSLTESPEYNSVWRLFSDCQFYNFTTAALRHPGRSIKERVLRSDGSNLANVLHWISQQHRPVFERIIQYLQVVDPSLKTVRSIEAGGFRSVQFEENNEMFYPLQISDGTLRSLATLVALFGRAGGAENISLVGLEEPETALHPAAAGALFDALREASANVQVIATTHSADLLDKKEIDTESILSVEQESGTTRIGHLDATGRQASRERLYTAGELMRMNHLRPEPLQQPPDSEMEDVLFGDLVPA